MPRRLSVRGRREQNREPRAFPENYLLVHPMFGKPWLPHGSVFAHDCCRCIQVTFFKLVSRVSGLFVRSFYIRVFSFHLYSRQKQSKPACLSSYVQPCYAIASYSGNLISVSTNGQQVLLLFLTLVSLSLGDVQLLYYCVSLCPCSLLVLTCPWMSIHAHFTQVLHQWHFLHSLCS